MVQMFHNFWQFFHLIFCFKLTHQLQTCYFSWAHTIQSHIFLFFLQSCTHWPYSHFLLSFQSFIFFTLIISNSSWLISMSINAWDTKVSMLSSLLLANIRILSCFVFFFLVMLSDFFIIPVVREKIKTCTCYSNWCSNNTCKLHYLVCLKQLKSCLRNQKQ